MALFAQQSYLSFVLIGRSPSLFHLTVVEFCSSSSEKSSLERSVANPAPALSNALLTRAGIAYNPTTMAVLFRARFLVVFTNTEKSELQEAIPPLANKVINFYEFFSDPFKLGWFAQFKMGAMAMRHMVMDHLQEAHEAHDANRNLNQNE
jgi:hypothetical protein